MVRVRALCRTPGRASTKGLPFGSSWKRVSSKRMAPEMYSLMPGVVNRRLRHVWRFSSVFSRPMLSRRAPTVPVDSSHARRPLPGRVMALAVAWSSSEYLASDICVAAGAARLVEGSARGATRASLEARSERARIVLAMVPTAVGRFPTAFS